MALTSATHDSSVNSTVFDQNLYWFYLVSSIASLGMRDKQCCLREVFREKNGKSDCYRCPRCVYGKVDTKCNKSISYPSVIQG